MTISSQAPRWNATSQPADIVKQPAGDKSQAVRAGQVPAFPPVTTQISNFAQSIVTFVSDGCELVDNGTYARHLEICRTCDRLKGDRCVACGCFVKVKARGRAFRCPIAKW